MLSMKSIFNKKSGIKFMGVMLGMLLVVPAFASIAVSPTRVEIDANKIRGNYFTTAIDIKGDTKVPMRFKAYSGYFKINEKSAPVIIENSNDVQDLSKKLRFVPSEFNVMQGKSQKLRINISNISALPDGESRAILYVEDVNPKEVNIPTGREGIGAQLIVKTRVGIPVYIDKGKVEKIATIENFGVEKAKDGLYTTMKVVTGGNSRVRYTTKGQIIQGKKLIDEFDMGGAVVGDNNFYVDRQKIQTENVKESGEYTLRVVVSYFDGNGKRKNIKNETKINIEGKM